MGSEMHPTMKNMMTISMKTISTIMMMRITMIMIATMMKRMKMMMKTQTTDVLIEEGIVTDDSHLEAQDLHPVEGKIALEVVDEVIRVGVPRLEVAQARPAHHQVRAHQEILVQEQVSEALLQ